MPQPEKIYEPFPSHYPRVFTSLSRWEPDRHCDCSRCEDAREEMHRGR